MDPTRINWSRRLAELISHDSDIPTDITFKFVKANDGNDEVSAQFNDVENEVSTQHNDGEVSAQSNDGDVSAQSNDVENEVSAHSNDVENEVSTQHNDGEVSAQHNDGEVSAQHNDGEVSTQHNDGEVSAQHNEDEVSAHKMILAVVSPMFRKMFYVHNTVDMLAQEIVMEDTTAPAFRIFIDAIYGVAHIQESLRDKSVDEVFGVLYLVTKYDIPELVRAVQDTFSSFPLTMDTVLEVADDVMDYADTFQEEAHQLLLTCAKFLKAKLTHADDVLGLIAENGDKMVVIHKLSVLIRKITPITIISHHYFSPVINALRPSKVSRPSNVFMENMPMPGLVESSEEESEADDSDEEAWDSVSSCGDSCDCLTGDSEVSDEESEEAAGDSGSDLVEPTPPFHPQNEDHNVMEVAHLLELQED